jgi:hypothetical protein
VSTRPWQLQTSPVSSGGGLIVPNPVEFATSPDYLGQTLTPRQGTILKVTFLRDDLFTAYDDEVLDEWTGGFDGTSRFSGV